MTGNSVQSDIEFFKYLMAFFAVVGVAFAGWNAHIQGKIKSLGKLWEWKDEFMESYKDDRLSDAKEYANKREVSGDMRHMEKRLTDRFDKIDDKLDEIIKNG